MGLNEKFFTSFSEPAPETDEILHLDAKNTSSYSGSGSAWNDLSGNQTASAISSASFDSTAPKSLNFPSSYTTLPYNTTFSEFSFYAWVKPSSNAATYRAVLGKWWDGSNRCLMFSNLNSTMIVDIAYSDSNADHVFTGTSSLTLNDWNFIAVTWKNGEGLTININNNTDTFSINKSINSNTNYWYIGNQDSRILNQFQGKISELKMWDEKITGTELTSIYNSTKATFGL